MKNKTLVEKILSVSILGLVAFTGLMIFINMMIGTKDLGMTEGKLYSVLASSIAFQSIFALLAIGYVGFAIYKILAKQNTNYIFHTLIGTVLILLTQFTDDCASIDLANAMGNNPFGVSLISGEMIAALIFELLTIISLIAYLVIKDEKIRLFILIAFTLLGLISFIIYIAAIGGVDGFTTFTAVLPLFISISSGAQLLINKLNFTNN